MTIEAYIPARWFTEVHGTRKINYVVLHSVEAENTPGTAESVARFFQNLPASSKASAHVCCDMDSRVRCVQDKDVAYAAPGLNKDGLHIELSGYARYRAGDWEQPRMIAMLRLGAEKVREWCAKYDIPAVYVDAAALKRGERGITTHNEVSKAFRQSDHWDPGPGFPIKTFISMVVDQPPPMIKEEDMEPYFKVNCPTGGYWIVKRSDGGIFGYEDRYGVPPHYGALPGLGVKLTAPIVSMEPYTVDRQVVGYWLLGADGGVFSFGKAPFTDSYAGHPEWHQGKRQFVGMRQNEGGYDLIAVVDGSDPPEQNVYDLSVKR